MNSAYPVLAILGLVSPASADVTITEVTHSHYVYAESFFDGTEQDAFQRNDLGPFEGSLLAEAGYPTVVARAATLEQSEIRPDGSLIAGVLQADAFGQTLEFDLGTSEASVYVRVGFAVTEPIDLGLDFAVQTSAEGPLTFHYNEVTLYDQNLNNYIYEIDFGPDEDATVHELLSLSPGLYELTFLTQAYAGSLREPDIAEHSATSVLDFSATFIPAPSTIILLLPAQILIRRRRPSECAS